MSKKRKHLTRKLLDELPEPGEDQKIVKVVGMRGTNQLEVNFPGSNEVILCMIPKKFQKLVWIKRGDYLIIKFDRSTQNIGKIKGIVEYLLLPKHIKNLKKKDLFPKEFIEEEQKQEINNQSSEYESSETSESESEEEKDDDDDDENEEN